MPNQAVTLVVGTGEVGSPLLRILSRTYRCAAVDIQPADVAEPCSVMHVCYPFQIPDFVGTTVRYIEKYRPSLTIINSTVAPGTTRSVYEAAGRPALAYSPVRGKHAKMEEDLLFYKKFVAGCDDESTEVAREHFAKAGLNTGTFRTPDIAELSKLLDTTYLGVLVAWAQETERLARRWGASFEEVNAIWQEVDWFRSDIFPGYIGGHCVMPNIAILRSLVKSQLLDAIVESNALKGQELPQTSSASSRP
jgi:UDP-glucose 6-dehydrogenase